MAYKANVPLGTDKLSNSQNDLNGNFQAINTFVAIDHIALNAANQGKHKKVSLVSQAAVPAVVAGEIGLGVTAMPGAIIPAVAAAITGGSELYLSRTDGVNNFVFPFTASLQADTGWCYLPSGIIMKWGIGSCPGSATFVDGVNIPVFSAVFTAQVTFLNAAAGEKWACWMSSYTTTTISTITDGGAKAYKYLVLGY